MGAESSRRQQLQRPAGTKAAGGQRVDAAVQFGALWVGLGLVSYTTLSLLARTALHSPQALQQQQAEVPPYVYDRSLFVFGTAFLLDVLGLLFELKSSRLDVVLLPAFVKGAATLTNALARTGWATVAFSASGRVVMVQRFVCWLHTTPTILVLVKMMATNISRQQAVRAVVCVELMCLTGLLGSLSAGWWAVFWGGLSHLAFLPILPYLHQGLKEAAAVVTLHAARPTMALVYYLTMLLWTGFGVVWDLRALDLIDMHTEEVAYLCCDFSAKVMFSAGLMLSSFKGLDSRREVVMRQIQEAHRQTLITELKRAIDQKDAFMSSVSHELRTPLNGIIGISEGLLANCCGPLSETVRKQLFIVRTSGARLLALINDVMDAATLRQARLVLKQERLELRQVVGDVVDLTRSLVDADVTLKNDVPGGLEVWADSGRIIQVLNNLLGNAAKFTHQGAIRVSAAWHDEQRQWVVVHVTDTGIGIPKQKLQSIFLPFEQVDGSISRQYGGFGLGLSITQELVKAHGGELWVKSKEHKGSQFAFTIPSFTGQKPPTPQQQAQLQARRSMAVARVGLSRMGTAEPVSPGLDLSRGRSMLLPAPISPASTAAEDGSPAAEKQVGPAAHTAAAAVGGPAVPAAPVNGPLTVDLLESCVGEDFAKELPYDAAQLSALASTKPFTAHQAPSSSGSASGSLQRVVSRATLRQHAAAVVDGEELDISLVPNTDQRPSQFACTGRYQILSVDDDPVNQTVVQSLLASTGYEVVCLYNGQTTLEYIENAAVLPDLILLDMLMPDMSGPDVCRQLALRQPPLGVPIILVSALAEESSVVTGLDSGADDYITKPFRRAEFLARIRGKLQLASVEQQARQASVPVPGADAGAEEAVVMCVTDDEVNHCVLEGILQSQNYRYLKVSSGAEALKLLEAAGSQPPHLVLLDAALPDTTDTTGLEVLQTIRTHFSQAVLPVIMLTARHNEKAIVQALDAGANDYAVKPFRRAELLARIRMHLRSSQKAAVAAATGQQAAAELGFAGQDGDEERLSAELQRSVSLQQLSSVPLLEIQLGGVSEALAGASAEQACQLMGYIADCFDALAEKYAVLKIEASDTSLTVAAPPSMGSGQNSARHSFQLPVLPQLSSPGHSGASLHFAAASSADPAESPGAAGAASIAGRAAAAAPAGALAAGLLQLLQMAQELQAYLNIDSPVSSAGSATPSDAARAASPQEQQHQQQEEGAARSSRVRPRTPLQLLHSQASQCWHGQLTVHMALHVGPLTAGVVGRRRPRYRLMGPALQVCRQACWQAPPNRTVATSSAADLLTASGVQGLKQLSGSTGGTASMPELQLWVLSSSCSLPGQQHLPGGGVPATAPGTTTAGLLQQAAAALAATSGTRAAASAGVAKPAASLLFGSPALPADGGGSLRAPASSAAATNHQPQRQAALGSGAFMVAQPSGADLPPLPLDPAVQQSQELLMQELSVLAQQLTATCAGPQAGMQVPWGQCLPANGVLGQPAASGFTLNCDPAGQQAAAAAPAVSTAAAAFMSTCAEPAAGSSEVVSASLSLTDWQASPKVASAQAGLQDSRVPVVAGVGSGPVLLESAAGGGLPPGLRLGAAEMQQINLLHQELAALQQQLSSAFMGGWGAPDGSGSALLQQHMLMYSAAGMPQQYCSYPLQNLKPQFSLEAPGSSAAGSSATPAWVWSMPSDAPAAATAMGNGLHSSSASSSDRSSGVGSSAAADSSKQSSGSAAQGGGAKGRPRAQLFGQLLFRRRSGRQQQEPQRPS